MASLLENKGSVQLFSNGDGSFYVIENGTQSPIYDMGGGSPWKSGGIVAADYFNGVRVVVFGGGHIWYMSPGWQKANVGPNNSSTDQVTPDQVNSLFLSGAGGGNTPTQPMPVPAPLPVTYNITGPSTVNEGSMSMFNLQTTGLPPGTSLTYNITGIDPSRIVGGQLSGMVGIDAGGSVPIPLPLAANNKTDGPSVVTIRLANGQAMFTAQVNDTSTSGGAPNPGVGTLVEGLGAVRLFQNTDGTYYVNDNGVLSTVYNMGSSTPLSGAGTLAAADFYNGSRVVVFNGGHLWYMNSGWQKAPVGPGGRDTENLSPAEVNAIFLSGSGGGNPPAPITGNATYTITGPSSVNEGEIAMFNLQTTGLPVGTSLTYNITGIDPSRTLGGLLSGSVGISISGSGPIPVPLAANNKTDGPATITISLTNGKASFSAQLNDTSTGGATAAGTLVEGFGNVKLYQNNGFMSVVENGQRFDIRDTDGVTKASGFVAADIINGVRQAVYSSGAIWYLDNTWKKAPTGPQGRDTDQIMQNQIATIFLTDGPLIKPNTPPVANQVSAVTLDPLVTIATPLNLAAPTDANGDTLTIRVDSLPVGVRIANNGSSLYVGQSFSVAEFTSLTATYSSSTSGVLNLGQLGFTVNDGKGGSISSSVAFTLKGATIKAPINTIGDEGNNQLQGSTGDDTISAGGGNDTILATTGNDVIDGGTGRDTLIFSINSSGASFSSAAQGIVKLAFGGNNYSLTGVERVQFSGKSFALDLNGNAGDASKLIVTAFGPSMVKEYLGIGLSLIDGGMSLAQLNDFIVDLGLLPTKSAEFVDLVFNNVVGRKPNQLESLIYVNMLDKGAQTRSSLLGLAESTSFVSDAITNISLAGVALEYSPSVF